MDETYIGGKRKNMPKAKRKELKNTGRGAVGKKTVVGVKDRKTNKETAKSVSSADKETLHSIVEGATDPAAKVYTDEARAYKGMDRDHESVNHSVSEYVRDQADTNGMESFWSMLKRGYVGTYHKMSPKHLDRYVNEFSGRHNVRESGTMEQLENVASGMAGKQLRYIDLIEDNGLSSGAKPIKNEPLAS